MSFFPSTCNVGVAYPSEKTVAEIGPAILNPDTETQNLLRGRMPSEQYVKNGTKNSEEARCECDIQRWVRRLAVHEERWIVLRPLKLRDIPIRILAHWNTQLGVLKKKTLRTRAASRAAVAAP